MTEAEANRAALVVAGPGVRIAVTDVGHGPAVVLLHGWPVTPVHWRATVPALVAAGLRALAVEPRGLGGRSTGSGPFDKATLAGEVVRALDALAVDRFAIVGHDWGGTIGYLVAADHPERVAALAVEEEILPGIDAPIPEPGRRHYPTWHGPFLRAPGLAEALVPGREDALHKTFLRQSAGPEPLPADVIAAYLAAYRGPAALAASVGYYRTADVDRQAVARRASSPLGMPVLAIGGELAMGTAVEACLRAVARHVRGIGVAGVGHYPTEQRPAVVNPPLVAFLRDAWLTGSGVDPT